MKVIWWCEHCHASGTFPTDKYASVHEVITLLTHQHANHELAQPGCVISEHVRVQIP